MPPLRHGCFIRPARALQAPLLRHRPRFPPSVRLITGQTGPPTPGNDPPNPVDDATDAHHGESESPPRDPHAKWKGTAFKMFESAMTTFASISILGMVCI